MKIIFANRLHIPLLVLAGLFGLGLIFSSEQGDASGSITPDQCCRCHIDVCEQSASKRYVHAPVLDNHCAVCHIKAGMSNPDPEPAAQESKQEVEWFARDCQEDNEHWFELPPQFASSTVSLMAKVGGEKVLAQEVDFPSLEQAERFPAPQGNPEIFDLRVVEVKKGVFLTARIAWKTDRITNAQVLYGEDGLTSTTSVDSRWATDHEITVRGLDAGRQYRFAAVSEDVFGGKGMSREMILSTQSFFTGPTLQAASAPAQVALRADFYQEQDRFFAHFETNYPVSMRLGYDGEQPMAMAAVDKDQASRPQGHLELTDPHSLTITVCVGCHPQSKGELSHPVDIRPKAGMHIPPDYYIMADGRLSCMSCHQAHASNNEYRLTRASRKDLCLGCHRNFG